MFYTSVFKVRDSHHKLKQTRCDVVIIFFPLSPTAELVSFPCECIIVIIWHKPATIIVVFVIIGIISKLLMW